MFRVPCCGYQVPGSRKRHWISASSRCRVRTVRLPACTPSRKRARRGPVAAARYLARERRMDPRVDRRIDEDLGKGAVETDSWIDPHDEAEWHTSAVALTEDVKIGRAHV